MLTNNENLLNITILNFIINKTYDIILMFVNIFTKYVTYIVIIKKLKADKFINLLY